MSLPIKQRYEIKWYTNNTLESIYPNMGQDIVVGIVFGLVVVTIVSETIAEKFPTKKFSKWWRENVVSEQQGNQDQGC
jgi:NhaP-type Na+/H+ or K+/H+ antiporter